MVDAGSGDDKVFANNGTAWESVDCGDGNDTIVININGANREYRNCETVLREAPVDDPTKGKHDIAGDGGETMRGTQANDKLLGGPGADRIYGEGGDDIIWGHRQPGGRSPGYDILMGGEGNDSIWGNRGKTLIRGGPGDDYLQGGELHNTIYGDEGDDTIKLRGNSRKQAGRNKVYAGAGNDRIMASGTLLAKIDCGPGKDSLDVGFNRRARWNGSCEKVKKGYKK